VTEVEPGTEVGEEEGERHGEGEGEGEGEEDIEAIATARMDMEGGDEEGREGEGYMGKVIGGHR